MASVDSRDYVLSGNYYSVLEPRRCAKHNVACQHSQQTWDVDPMLVQCWPTICDAVKCWASIHSPYSVFHAAWWERVHIRHDVLLQTAKWKYLLISQVCIYCLLEGLWQALLQTAKWKYLLISQVCIYRLWKGCDRQKRAQWRQWIESIYLIYKWAQTAFWQHCYTLDRNEWDTQTHRTPQKHWKCPHLCVQRGDINRYTIDVRYAIPQMTLLPMIIWFFLICPFRNICFLVISN